MSDKVAKYVKWLQWVAQAIGIAIALLGGGQKIASSVAPDAYGSYSEPAGDNLLGGMLLTIGAPALSWVVTKVWGLTRGKKLTPQTDFLAADGAVTVVELYLDEKLPDIRGKVAARYQDGQKPAVLVEAK